MIIKMVFVPVTVFKRLEALRGYIHTLSITRYDLHKILVKTVVDMKAIEHRVAIEVSEELDAKGKVLYSNAQKRDTATKEKLIDCNAYMIFKKENEEACDRKETTQIKLQDAELEFDQYRIASRFVSK